MASFEILEHTADVGIRATGATLEQVFATAAMAVQWIALASDQIQPRSVYTIAASGDDYESLLVNWLNEVIYFLDGRRVVISRFEVKTLTGSEITAEGWGEEYDPERHPMQLVVKAATYHQLKLTHEDDRWVAEVYLDI